MLWVPCPIFRGPWSVVRGTSYAAVRPESTVFPNLMDATWRAGPWHCGASAPKWALSTSPRGLPLAAGEGRARGRHPRAGTGHPSQRGSRALGRPSQAPWLSPSLPSGGGHRRVTPFKARPFPPMPWPPSKAINVGVCRADWPLASVFYFKDPLRTSSHPTTGAAVPRGTGVSPHGPPPGRPAPWEPSPRSLPPR